MSVHLVYVSFGGIERIDPPYGLSQSNLDNFKTHLSNLIAQTGQEPF